MKYYYKKDVNMKILTLGCIITCYAQINTNLSWMESLGYKHAIQGYTKKSHYKI